MVKLIKRIAMVFVFLLLAGCQPHEEQANLKWFPSKEAAIEAGLQQEGAERTAVLDIVEENGETLVFFERFDALGVAQIAKGPEGFGWYRDRGYLKFETDSEDPPFSYAGFDLQTYSGSKVSVIAGKVHNPSVQKLLLRNGGNEQELQLHGESGWFFAAHDSEFRSLNVVPVYQ